MHKAIYLTGGWGYGNRGDNAIFAGMIQSISQAGLLTDHELLVTSYDPEETKAHNGVDAIYSLHKHLTKERRINCFWDRVKPSFNFWHRFAFWLWKKTNHQVLLPSAIKHHLALLKKAKVLIMGGGGYFNDAWPDMLYSKYVEIELAEYVGCPVMIYGQTVGPFSDKVIDESLKQYLNKIATIAYRDQQSSVVLSKSGYGGSAMLTADEANLLAQSQQTVFENNTSGKIILGVMIQNFRPHLGVSGETGANNITNSDEYYQRIGDALNKIISPLVCHIVFIPSTTWDVKSNKKVFNKIQPNPQSSKAFLESMSTETFIGACQQVDLMISTNMHPVILSATGVKPSVAISYHYKLDDYMESIGLSEYIIRIDDFSVDQLVDKVNNALEQRKHLSQVVQEHHQTVKQMAENNMKLLNQLLTH